MALLSDRLFEIAQMVTPGLKVADIGCDHAYLSIHLIKENIAKGVIACDVNKGPVEIAKANIKQAGLSDIIEVRLSDGLDKIAPGEVNSVVIAGMGGPLIISILENGKSVLDKVDEIIVEPQSEVSKVRHYLEDNGYKIVNESMICDENKYYPIIKAVHGRMYLQDEIYYKFGKLPIDEANHVLYDFLTKRRTQLDDIISSLAKAGQSDSAKERLATLKDELCLCEKALAKMKEKQIR